MNDLEITRCLFAGNEILLPFRSGIIANANSDFSKAILLSILFAFIK